MESDSGSSSGTSTSFCSDKEVSKVSLARSSYGLALVNFLGGKYRVFTVL